MNFKDFNLEKNDLKYLIPLLIFSIALVAYYINFNMGLGIYSSDIYVYLLNGLFFTGKDVHAASNIYLSPPICFLTGILMLFGITNKLSIFIVTGAFAILANIALYTLFKVRFNGLLSLTGTVIFSSFSLNLLWLANGSIDLPAVAMIILLIVILIPAINKDSKYFKILIPLFIIGFFLRYTVILLLPILILYYAYKRNFIRFLCGNNRKSKLKAYRESKEYKDIKKGLIYGIIILALFIIFILIVSGTLGFLSSATSRASGQKGRTIDPAYTTNPYFYLELFPNMLSCSKTVFNGYIPVLKAPTILSYGLIAIIIIGIAIYLYDNIKSKKFHHKKLLIPMGIFLIASVISYGRLSSLITIFLILISLLILRETIKDFDYIDFNLMCISWILVNLIFFNYMNIKVDRYLMPIFPAIAYLIIASLENIGNKLKLKTRTKQIICIGLILIFIASAFSFVNTIEDTNTFKEPEEIRDYLIHYDPDYEDKVIASTNIRFYDWELKKPMLAVTHTELYKLEENNVTYFISNKHIDNVSNYYKLTKIGNTTIFKHK